MDIVAIIFLLLTTFSTVYSGNNQNFCPSSYCEDLSVEYPFKLQTTQPQNNCTYIDLTCNYTKDNVPVIVARLPFAGDYYASAVNYIDSYIKLYDPGDCLMRRLINNFNLSSSPFKAFFHENYTFYKCPFESNLTDYGLLTIDCLSNLEFATVATARLSSGFMLKHSCQIIGSWLLPVLFNGQFESVGISSDLYLTWNSTTCIDCEEEHTNYTGANLWAKFVTLFILLLVCSLYIRKLMAWRNEAVSDPAAADGLPESATATATPPLPTAGGLDEPKINACTELVVLSENRINSEPNSHTCSICLDSCDPQQLVRNITKCQHYFHADCIEMWLYNNRTCPVCRAILSDIDL